jgi:hypothetical protein
MTQETENATGVAVVSDRERNPAPAPVKSLFEVFPKPLVIGLGLVFCLCFCILVYIGAFQSFRYYDRMARGWAIAGCGFCLGYFMYLAFPQRIEITKIPIIDKVVTLGSKLSGPPALFIIMVGILNWLIPGGDDVSVRYFAVNYIDNGNPVSGYSRDYRPSWKDNRSPREFIPVKDDTGTLLGVIVEFDGGVTQYTGTVTDNYHPAPGYPVKFMRGSGIGTLPIPKDKD